MLIGKPIRVVDVKPAYDPVPAQQTTLWEEAEAAPEPVLQPEEVGVAE